ncbi:DNA-binding protein [Caproiciproducens sp. NJN-50]|uniref:YlxM family DNA-binding protein n=1 Tax=Acutalibacteraceae TaxID=3082771 RepID=UPI000FFE2204|nr:MULTISPECIES: YlxM family DNA-binding protein [Acutalibacteraceae]QAT50162.1 DNA-binding protein [Caproiciproducens sp. NJN-50]
MAKDLKISLLLDFYGSMLTEKQRRIVEYYYDDDLSLSEIAENEGITRQGVRDFVKRAEEQLLEMEQKLGLARRFREMMDGFQRIEEAANRIRDYNEHYIYAREIDESAKQILEITRRLCE